MVSGVFTSDSLITELGGCGRFQILTTCLGYLPYLACSYTTIFMVFGIYNPGWTCQDKDVTSLTDIVKGKEPTTWTFQGYQTSGNLTSSCHIFETCQRIHFYSEASTIVTEWKLVCGRAWILTAIISIQMAGILFGNVFTGYLGDIYGYKFVMYSSLFINAALNILSIFSVSWEMFATIRFLLGITCSLSFSMGVAYVTEFAAPKWRTSINCFPVWGIGCASFAVCAMLFPNWKHLQLINAIMSLVFCLSGFALPESLRWLTTHGKQKIFLKTAAKIAKMNKAELPCENCLKLLTTPKDNDCATLKIASSSGFLRSHKRSFLLLWGLELFCINLIYFALSFGVSNIPGNIYLNCIIVFASEIPFNIIVWLCSNIRIRRKPLAVWAFLAQITSPVGIIVLDLLVKGTTRDFNMLTFVVVARASSGVQKQIMRNISNELFSGRTLSLDASFGTVMANVGAVISPFLIPTGLPASYFTYLTVAAINLFCGLLILLVLETIGKDLPEEPPVERQISSHSTR